MKRMKGDVGAERKSNHKLRHFVFCQGRWKLYPLIQGVVANKSKLSGQNFPSTPQYGFKSLYTQYIDS